MSISRAVLITGAAGGIGNALVKAYAADGWYVIATDRESPIDSIVHAFVSADLEAIATDDRAREVFRRDILTALDGVALGAIVNNAALQILGSVGDVDLVGWERTLRVNLTAPFRLAQAFLTDLRAANGVIINIGSVHAQATKREFVAYATSKSALHGMTRAMAVDIGESPRVICVAPAAVATPMLQEGFEGKSEAFEMLSAAHPSGRIADPAEIARAVVALSGESFRFATGTTFWLDGGILSRLHDPV